MDRKNSAHLQFLFAEPDITKFDARADGADSICKADSDFVAAKIIGIVIKQPETKEYDKITIKKRQNTYEILLQSSASEAPLWLQNPASGIALFDDPTRHW